MICLSSARNFASLRSENEQSEDRIDATLGAEDQVTPLGATSRIAEDHPRLAEIHAKLTTREELFAFSLADSPSCKPKKALARSSRSSLE